MLRQNMPYPMYVIRVRVSRISTMFIYKMFKFGGYGIYEERQKSQVQLEKVMEDFTPSVEHIERVLDISSVGIILKDKNGGFQDR